MALPKLTVRLFPPKPGKSYSSSGNLSIPIADVHAFAEWLLGQPGEFDEYAKENVVRLLAFEYQNTAKSGSTYRTVQLRDPAAISVSTAATPSAFSSDLSAGMSYDDEVPF
jgi:hypothetical protein